MARSLPEIVSDVRTLIGKNKLKAARKALDKANKSGHKGPLLQEATAELLIAEGGGESAAVAIKEVARVSKTRIPALLKIAESHLRAVQDDHDVRDAVWEIALASGKSDHAARHLETLLENKGIDPTRRAKTLVARKDEVGAVGIFLLASLGGVSTDRLTLAKRLLRNEGGSKLLGSVATALRDQGRVDGPVHYVLAQLAHQEGDHEAFLENSAAAADEFRDEILTWTGSMEASDRLDLALKLDALDQVIKAAGEVPPDSLAAAANRVQGDEVSGRVVRGLAALVTGKPANACRILEEVVRREKSAAAPLADVLRLKSASWAGAREAHGAIVAEGLWADDARLQEGADSLLHVPEEERGDAWARAASRLLERAPNQGDLRCALGLALLKEGEVEKAVALLQAPEHLEAARAWVEAGASTPEVLRAAAELAERYDHGPHAAEWLLVAAKDDKGLLAEIGKRLRGSAVSPATALQSAAALLDQDQREEAAGFLDHLPLDKETGQAVDSLLKERELLGDPAFEEVSLRCALSLGDGPRARRNLKAASSGMEALAVEAMDHSDAARVLAELLIGEGAAPTAVRLLEGRRQAGDPPRSLLPLADALLKKSAQLAGARLLRARLLAALDRRSDAVRDLRTIPGTEAEADEAFALLGELEQDEGAGTAALGRADILVAKKDYAKAIKELSASRAPAADRLERFDKICKDKPDLDRGQRGRAVALLELKRVAESAEAHFRRFHCRDADPGAVADDLESVAKVALQGGDIATVGSILERLPEHVGNGAERAIQVIGESRQPPLLILRSKLLLQRERTEEAVRTLADLVREDEKSRPQAAQALQAIVESGQARPEVDFALAQAFEAMGHASQALGALQKLYEDDITAKESVLKAGEGLVLRSDDADVRLFLARVSLDMRDAGLATEHCVHARRLRPDSRRDVVTHLQRALDLDAFAANTHFALAEAHLAGDEVDDAVRHFRAAVEVDRGRASPTIASMEEAAPHSKRPALLWLAVGTTYAEFLRNHENAVQAYTHGLDANPTTEVKVPLLLGRGDAYAALQQDDQAFDDFDQASHHDVLERRYYEFLRSRHRKRVLEAAVKSRDTAMEDFREAAGACGRFVLLGMPGEAVTVAQNALSQDPSDLRARYLVGVSLHAAGRYDAAARALEAVRSGSGADTEIGRAARMLLAESYLDQGDRDTARACLVEIESVDAAYPGLKARRGSLAPPADDPQAPPPLFVRPEFPRPTE